ncbi:MAG TPA: hypothetical protein VF221_15075 [Chloroflexota bacterium]
MTHRPWTWRLLPALLLAGVPLLGAAKSGATHAGSRSHRTQSAAQILAYRLVQPIPYRNLFTLANELKLRPPRKIPSVVSRTSPNYPVGHQDSFSVMGEDTNKIFQLKATIRIKTPHLYLYVQNGVKESDAALQKAAHTFETSTYPTDRALYGSEWRPGIDGDPHITCLVGNLRSSRSGTAGFFSAEDEYPRAVYTYSNQREMFYINSVNTQPGTADFDFTLAHEFQHMIHWHMHPHEELWLNEGMSILAQVLNKYSDDGMADAFLSEPHTQLNTWNEDNPFPHYGAAYLFLSYLYDHYGRGVIRAIVADKKYTDFPLIDDALHQLHLKPNGRQIFERWALANVLDDPSLAHGMYAYKALTRAISLEPAKSLPVSYTGHIAPYTADYVTVDTAAQKKPVQFRFQASPTVPMMGGTGTGPFWYANRGDMSDTRMERVVNLTRAHRATLHFETWYDIEKGYDYGYVEASQDGGKTWITLRGTHTTTSNPNGANYGNAYTGPSKGWQSETVDLSAYAGKRIQIRFEYVTDDGYTGQGWAVKNISIPEIGFHDTLSGWSQQGFVPVYGDAVAASWSFDLISYMAHGEHVTHVPISAAGTASTTIDPTKTGVKKVVAVVFVTSPKTTAETSYGLSATGG